MARKPKEKAEVKLWEKAKWEGFVNLKLSTEEKKAIKNSLLKQEDCFATLQALAEDGYKVSLSYSIPEDVYTAAVTGTYQGRPNAGITMSLRHRDIVTAVSGLAWCHEQAGKDGEWSERFGGGSNEDW